MFTKAYNIVSKFTFPVIISNRFFDKSVNCSCGAFVIVNNKGWIVTVAHIFQSFFIFNKHKKEMVDYNKYKNNQKSNPKWITNHSFWWSADGVQLKEVKVLPKGDLAIGKLEPFNPKVISIFPTFKNPISNFNPGTSLCKLGYPFYKIKAIFNEKNNAFEIAPNTLPLPRFPIEGIFTRNISAGKSKDGKHTIKFLETSSPGLRGQSGGPIFDIHGRVWGIQSRTIHFPLGFSPKIKKNNQEIEENQFLNVGWGIHPELLISFFSDNKIEFNLSKD